MELAKETDVSSPMLFNTETAGTFRDFATAVRSVTSPLYVSPKFLGWYPSKSVGSSLRIEAAVKAPPSRAGA